MFRECFAFVSCSALGTSYVHILIHMPTVLRTVRVLHMPSYLHLDTEVWMEYPANMTRSLKLNSILATVVPPGTLVLLYFLSVME